MDFQQHKAMLAALEAGTATPEQQRAAAFAHLQSIKRQHNQELRDAERDSRDAYHEGRYAAGAEARGEPFGSY